MKFFKNFERNWLTSSSLVNLEDEFAPFKRRIEDLKDDSKYYERLKGLAQDLDIVIQEEDSQKGWKIFKEMRRLVIYTLPKEEVEAEAHTILREAESKTQESIWRFKTIKEILLSEDNKTLRSDLKASHVVKAAEVLDEHQDNFYERLETIRRRIRTLSWITLVSLITWVWIGPEISEFPMQKELSKSDIAAQYEALYKKLDTIQSQNSTERRTESEAKKDTTTAKKQLKATADSSKTKKDTSVAKDQSNAVADTTKAIKDIVGATPAKPGKDTTRSANLPKVKVDEIKKDTSKRYESKSYGIKDINKKPRWLAFLVILTGIIGAVVSGFIRTIQFGTDGNVPDQVFGSTLLAARLMLASVAALTVYVFLGTGVILLFGTKISFELLLAFSFVAGFSEQLVQKGVDSLSKQAPNDKSDKSGK
jgi:hypothetical protein